jgi:hypothetical protein
VEINGRLHPDTVVLHVGTRARFRFINLSSHHNSARATFALETVTGDERDANAGATLVRWQPLAKDGADLPEAARVPRLARQVVTIGETYDFEYTPERRGFLRIQVTTTPGPLQPPHGAPLIAVPIRVE